MQLEMVYCGHTIYEKVVSPVAATVDAIKDAPIPKDVTQLRAFLGMLNYYYRFLPDAATILEPLHNLLRKGRAWKWNREQQEEFMRRHSRQKSKIIIIVFFCYIVCFFLIYKICCRYIRSVANI